VFFIKSENLDEDSYTYKNTSVTGMVFLLDNDGKLDIMSRKQTSVYTYFEEKEIADIKKALIDELVSFEIRRATTYYRNPNQRERYYGGEAIEQYEE
jgi:hypothetical protein